MKAVVLGGSGMLGHKVAQVFSRVMPAVAVSRRPLPPPLRRSLETVDGIDASDFDSLRRVLEHHRPTVVINCIGIVKQLAAAKDPIPSIELNALLPHRIAEVCRDLDARLVHVSTDCVFSGDRGMYTEADFPDAADLYGRSKLLGEVQGDGALTLRTSIIGRELAGTSGVIEWFLSNRGGTIDGYEKAVFSGLTTIELARVMLGVVRESPLLSGIYHVSAEAISKFDLLTLANDAFEAGVTIRPSAEVRIDRSLDSTRFRRVVGWRPPSWSAMIRELAGDPTPYDEWRLSD